MGVICTGVGFKWHLIEGSCRSDVKSLEWKKVEAPGARRGDQLAWVRKEILELLETHRPEVVQLRVSDSGSASIGKAEVEGVVAEGLASADAGTRP